MSVPRAKECAPDAEHCIVTVSPGDSEEVPTHDMSTPGARLGFGKVGSSLGEGLGSGAEALGAGADVGLGVPSGDSPVSGAGGSDSAPSSAAALLVVAGESSGVRDTEVVVESGSAGGVSSSA